MAKKKNRYLKSKKSITFAKAFSVGITLSLMLAMVPQNGAFSLESSKFVVPAYASHWGRSDLRAYLNNGLADVADDGTVSNKNYGKDSTTGPYASNNKSGYAKHFSNAEYDLVQAFTYSTNEMDINRNDRDNANYAYDTTDKFWLPSGFYEEYTHLIFLVKKDVSSDSNYTSGLTYNSPNRYFSIPISYFNNSSNGIACWLRSTTSHHGSAEATTSNRNSSGSRSINSESVDSLKSLSPAFKIDLSYILFASTAAAANIVGISSNGAKKIEIDGTSKENGNYAKFGKRSAQDLPDYGMYLKTKSTDTFIPNSLSLAGNTLKIDYTGGVANDQYVMLHAFKDDDLENGTSSYVAAQKLVTGQNEATIDITNWNLSSLDGYTIKIWMEDNSGSLAKATQPETFIGNSGTITKTSEGEIKNVRVFAMKDELQCSWGDLSKLSDEDFTFVTQGKAYYTSSGLLSGKNPTNQKIYFGTSDNNKTPMQFWVAGREDKVNDGNVSETGEFMTLYQAKSVETQKFNASKDNYKGLPLLNLQDNLSAIYNGNPTTYPGTITYQTYDETPLDNDNPPTFQYSTDGGNTWNNGMPTTAGTYKIRAIMAESDLYESVTSDPVTFTINQTSNSGSNPSTNPNPNPNTNPDSNTNPNPNTSPDSDTNSDSDTNNITDQKDLDDQENYEGITYEERKTQKAATKKTGDIFSYLTISGLCLVTTLALGLIINSKVNKKKFNK